MAVEGPLAMRTNEWMPKETNKAFAAWEVVSPTRNAFSWNSPVVWASCYRCPKDEDDHVIISDSCTCGIYATLRLSTMEGYMNSHKHVPYLVEALGTYLLGTEGFRAAGVQLIAVLRLPGSGISSQVDFSSVELSSQAASEHFNIPIIDYYDALEMIKIMWEREGMELPHFMKA